MFYSKIIQLVRVSRSTSTCLCINATAAEVTYTTEATDLQIQSTAKSLATNHKIKHSKFKTKVSTSAAVALIRPAINSSALCLRRNNCTHSSKLISSGALKSGDISSQLPLVSYKLNGSAQLDPNVPFKLEQPKLQILDRPNDFLKSIIDVPKISTLISYEDIEPNKEISEPEPKQKEEKHAVRMIIIRKRKMRVHKRKKWRKKMKHVIAKYRIRREIKKEKDFQAELMAKVKEAEKFDPALYVKNKLAMANKEIVPHRWKGKRLPEFVIKHEISFAMKKHRNIQAAAERRRNMNTNAADYK